MLLLYGANPLLKNKMGYTAYNYAQERGNSKCVDVLQPLAEKDHLSIQVDNYDGFQTAKNSEGQFIKVKNDIGMNCSPLFNVSNTSRNNFKISYYGNSGSENNRSGCESQMKLGLPQSEHQYQIPPSTRNQIERGFFEVKQQSRRERNKSCNFNTKHQNFSMPNDDKDSNSFLSQMHDFEERLKKIRNQLNEASNNDGTTVDRNQSSTDYENHLSYNTAPFKGLQEQDNRSVICNSNIDQPDMLSYMNFANLIKTHKKTHSQNNFYPSTKIILPRESPKNSHLLLAKDNRAITMKQDDYEECAENLSRITHATLNNFNEDIYNFPLQKSTKIKNKVSENYFMNLEMIVKRDKEIFIDNNEVLATFTSIKNDINDSDVCEDTLFKLNINDVDGEYVQTDDDIACPRQNTDKKNVKYFSSTNRSRSIRDDYKQILLDTQSLHESSLIEYNTPELLHISSPTKVIELYKISFKEAILPVVNTKLIIVPMKQSMK